MVSGVSRKVALLVCERRFDYWSIHEQQQELELEARQAKGRLLSRACWFSFTMSASESMSLDCSLTGDQILTSESRPLVASTGKAGCVSSTFTTPCSSALERLHDLRVLFSKRTRVRSPNRSRCIHSGAIELRPWWSRYCDGLCSTTWSPVCCFDLRWRELGWTVKRKIRFAVRGHISDRHSEDGTCDAHRLVLSVAGENIWGGVLVLDEHALVVEAHELFLAATQNW